MCPNTFQMSSDDYEFPSTMEEIDALKGHEFEEFLFNFFDKVGWNPNYKAETNDKGIDIDMTWIDENHNEKLIGIQAKRWKSPVGVNEIKYMMEGKKYYHLEEIWLITTSKLTVEATRLARNERIKIFGREKVQDFLEHLKQRTDVVFIGKTKPAAPIVEAKNEAAIPESPLATALRQFRIDYAKKNNISPIYFVFSNSTIQDIVEKKPTKIEDLQNIKGLGEKRIQQYGQSIIEIVQSLFQSVKPVFPEEVLKKIRKKINAFNKFKTNDESFNDDALKTLVFQKFDSLDELSSVKGMNKTNFPKFGKFLFKELNSKGE